MAQRVYAILDLPGSSIEASAAFTLDHLDAARAAVGEGAADSLVITLPPAGPDHSGWRTALARDLARAHAPARVNVIAGADPEALAALCTYLNGAKGVTGHYLQTHE